MRQNIFRDDLKKKMQEAVQTVKTTAQSTVEVISENAAKSAENVKASFEKKQTRLPDAWQLMQEGVISVSAALKVFYYLIAADGEIKNEEMEKLDSIGQSLDPKFPEYREHFLKECALELQREKAPGDDYDIYEEAADRALRMEIKEVDSFLPANVFIWNMLVVACNDGKFDSKERNLIRHLVRSYKIDYAVYLEMESSALAALDIETELQWIKTTDRPYLQIEELVNELNNRRDTIYRSVEDLIAL